MKWNILEVIICCHTISSYMFIFIILLKQVFCCTAFWTSFIKDQLVSSAVIFAQRNPKQVP